MTQWRTGIALGAFGAALLYAAASMWPDRRHLDQTVYLTAWAGLVALLAGVVLVATG